MYAKLLVVFAILAVTAPNVTAAAPAPERQQALRHLLKNDCGACHGLTLRGGLGPALLPENLGDKPEALLLQTILDGRKGTAMPPWRPFLSDDEARWLLQLLLRGEAAPDKTD